MPPNSSAGPKKIIDLDSTPISEWRLERNAMHILGGILRSWEPVGCVKCVDEAGPGHSTFSHFDESGKEHFHCMKHGSLDAIEYKMTKNYELTIGGVTRTGKECQDDQMFFPSSMSEKEKNNLIEAMLNEAEKEEEEDDEF